MLLNYIIVEQHNYIKVFSDDNCSDIGLVFQVWSLKWVKNFKLLIILINTIYQKQVQYPIHRHTHSTIKLDILIRRKYTFFIMNLVVPCALIACMIFLVFVLPAKSGERISLGITVMLSMAIFQELSSEKLPSSSDNYPLLGKHSLILVVSLDLQY